MNKSNNQHYNYTKILILIMVFEIMVLTGCQNQRSSDEVVSREIDSNEIKDESVIVDIESSAEKNENNEATVEEVPSIDILTEDNTDIPINLSAIHWSMGEWKNKVYVFDEYHEEVYGLDDGEGGVVFQKTEYIRVEMNDNVFNIVDSINYDDKYYVIDSEKRYLNRISSDGVLIPIVETPILKYTKSDYGIVFNSFNEDIGLYFYDFEKEELVILNSEVEIKEVRMSDKYIVGLTDKSELLIFSMDDLELFNTLEMLDISNDGSNFTVDDQYLYARDNEFMNVYNISTLEIIDSFECRDITVSNENRVFYTFGGSVIEYIAETKEQEIIRLFSYGVYINAIGNELIVYQGVDGPGNSVVYNKDERYTDDVDLLAFDYMIVYKSTEYGSDLYLNDLKNNRLEKITSAERRVDYEVKDDQLVYRIVSNKLDEESKMWVPDPQEWMTLDLRKNSNVYDNNQEINRVKENIRWNINEGHIYEEEIIELDQGRFIVYANPEYNDGKWLKKGLQVFDYTTPSRGNTISVSDFSVNDEVNLSHIVVNSNRNRFYVIYEEEGIQQVALFSVDAMKNSAKLMRIENLIGEVSWSKDELDIIN